MNFDNASIFNRTSGNYVMLVSKKTVPSGFLCFGKCVTLSHPLCIKNESRWKVVAYALRFNKKETYVTMRDTPHRHDRLVLREDAHPSPLQCLRVANRSARMYRVICELPATITAGYYWWLRCNRNRLGFSFLEINGSCIACEWNLKSTHFDGNDKKLPTMCLTCSLSTHC